MTLEVICKFKKPHFRELRLGRIWFFTNIFAVALMPRIIIHKVLLHLGIFTSKENNWLQNCKAPKTDVFLVVEKAKSHGNAYAYCGFLTYYTIKRRCFRQFIPNRSSLLRGPFCRLSYLTLTFLTFEYEPYTFLPSIVL